MRWLTGERPCDVLDLGAGTGKLTRSLVALGHRVTAVEPLEQMLAQLATRRARAWTRSSGPRSDPASGRLGRRRHLCAGVPLVRPRGGPRRDRAGPRPGGRLALVWNTRDEREPWVDELSEAMVGRSGIDHGVAEPIERSGLFGPVEQADFEHVQEIDRVALQELVLSRSYCAILSPEERRPILERVDAIFEERSRDGIVRLPYLTVCFRAVQRCSPSRWVVLTHEHVFVRTHCSDDRLPPHPGIRAPRGAAVPAEAGARARGARAGAGQGAARRAGHGGSRGGGGHPRDAHGGSARDVPRARARRAGSRGGRAGVGGGAAAPRGRGLRGRVRSSRASSCSRPAASSGSTEGWRRRSARRSPPSDLPGTRAQARVRAASSPSRRRAWPARAGGDRRGEGGAGLPRAAPPLAAAARGGPVRRARRARRPPARRARRRFRAALSRSGWGRRGSGRGASQRGGERRSLCAGDRLRQSWPRRSPSPRRSRTS